MTSIGRSGFGVNLNAKKRNKELECHLWIDHSEAKNAFAALLEQKDTIIASLGNEVRFDPMDGTKCCKIFETSTGDITEREQWPTMHRWLKSRGEAFANVFTPLVKQLKLD